MGIKQGWIRLHRKIMNTPEWLAEPFTRGQAWVDLLLLANHETGFICKRGVMIAVERGQVGYSEDTLAARWRWSRGKVRRFIAELTRLFRISRRISEKTVQKNASVSSLIYIVNYDKYQMNDTESSTEDGRKTVQEQRIKRIKRNILSDSDIPYEEIITYLNEKTGKHFRATTKETRKCISARWKDFPDLKAFQFVIDVKCAQWLNDPQMEPYLRPQTLFGTKFESYLNESMPKEAVR